MSVRDWADFSKSETVVFEHYKFDLLSHENMKSLQLKIGVFDQAATFSNRNNWRATLVFSFGVAIKKRFVFVDVYRL